MIGTGTPARAARRPPTRAALPPRSSFPATDRSAATTASIPGMPSDVARDLLDHGPPPPARLRRARSASISRHALQELLADEGIGPDRTDWQPRRAGEAGQRDQEDELLPDRHASVADRFRLDVGADNASWICCTRARTSAADRRRLRRTRCGGACRSARSRRAPLSAVAM